MEEMLQNETTGELELVQSGISWNREYVCGIIWEVLGKILH